LTHTAGEALAAGEYEVADTAETYETGRPARPSEAWLISAGGRIYDTWWQALGRPAPVYGSHPAYPEDGKATGADTWRCAECHGWDYRGAAGHSHEGTESYTGIKGIEAWKGRDESDIIALLRAPLHGYTEEMIGDDGMERIAAFVSRGQVDMSRYFDLQTGRLLAGDPERGRMVFQTICAACHGFDERLLDFGSGTEHAYIGTEATANPTEVFHRILSGFPGREMINLRAFGPELAIDVLSYEATLPTE